jgi:hypothetical protein
MNFYKTPTGTYMGLNATEFYQVTFGKRQDGTFYFSQETFPAEMLPELEEIYNNPESQLTPVDWTDSPVTQAEVEAQLEQNLQLGNLIN